MKIAAKSLALSLGAALALAVGLAVAQQPAPPPGQPQLPPGHQLPGHQFPPSQFPPGMGQPGMGQPGRPPVIIGPDGRPQGLPPGSRPPQRPGRPGGFPPGFGPPGQRPPQPHPRPQPHAVEHEEEHAEHECPGHGPDDPPPPMNLWHGMLMVNNERATQPGFLNQLLFRYENPKNPCDERNEPPPFLASLLNFGIFAFILYRFARKPLADALVQRKQSIMAEIDKDTKLKKDAEKRLREYKDKIANMADKLAEVRAEYAAQAEIEQEHVLAEAEERRVRMRRDAEFRVEQERKAVREELLREAVLAATAAAEAVIAKQMSRADQDRMAADYLTSVGAALGDGAGAPLSAGGPS